MILYTSENKKLEKHLTGLIIATVFFAVFGGIYEYFSHEVYSFYMLYAFMIPLIMGVLPYSVMLLKGRPGFIDELLWHWDAVIATFTLGSVFKGVLDIYGTTNKLLIVYPVAGIVLAAVILVGCTMTPKELT